MASDDGGHTLLNRPGAPSDNLGFIAEAINTAIADYDIDAPIYLTSRCRRSVGTRSPASRIRLWPALSPSVR